MRKYQAIWERIKSQGKCKVAAPAKFHSRIKKAVTKEFNKDRDFREECDAKGILYPWVRKESAEDTILFTLRLGPGYEDFGVSAADMAILDFQSIDFEDLLNDIES